MWTCQPVVEMMRQQGDANQVLCNGEEDQTPTLSAWCYGGASLGASSRFPYGTQSDYR